MFDTGIVLAAMQFVGTDHVFRFGPQRMEAFSGMLVGLHQFLRQKDLQGYQTRLPLVLSEWQNRFDRVQGEWGGVITMDTDGAVFGLRRIDAGKRLEQYVGDNAE